MSKPARIALLLALAAFPLLEIGLLIRTGQTIGFWRLVALIIVTVILGTLVIRRVGLAMAGRVVAGLGRGGDGLKPILNAGLLVIAGMLLIFPGLISDTAGLLLLVPAIRHHVVDSGIIKFLSGVAVHIDPLQGEASTMSRGGRPDDLDTGNTVTIEGEYERLDETDVNPGTGLRPADRRPGQ